jgi:hypothetical protein
VACCGTSYRLADILSASYDGSFGSTQWSPLDVVHRCNWSLLWRLGNLQLRRRTTFALRGWSYSETVTIRCVCLIL